jgi:hypothetical protein
MGTAPDATPGDHVRLNAGGLLLVDDITLNAGIWAAWDGLSTGPGWSVALHLGRVGLLLRLAARHESSAQADLSAH